MRIRQIENYVEKMPSLPTTVTKILEVCNDPRANPSDLNKVISLDPVLMGKVMKLINSAYYGLSQEITSLVRAIIMLGINTVKNLALSTAVLGTLGAEKNFSALNMDGYWSHCLGVGVTARLIAKLCKVAPSMLEEYFVAGLLHDIGKIPLNNLFPEEYVSIMGRADITRAPLFLAEGESLGVDHGEVGGMILHSWRLDEEITGATRYHHRPEEYPGQDRQLLYSVVLANYFVNEFGIGFSGNRYPHRPDHEIYNALGIKPDFFSQMEDTVRQEIQRAKIFLSLTE